jgi:phosphonate transport system substrate-binding protein
MIFSTPIDSKTPRNLSTLAAAATVAALGLGAQLLLASSAQAQARDLVLGVSEGTSGGIDHARGIAKYAGLSNMLAETLKRRVVVQFVREFSQLEDGMKAGRFDLVLARPSDYPARGVRNHGYRYVAHAKPDGQCLVIVPKNTALKSLADAKGKRWVMPEQVSYMSKFCTAELRDQGIDLSKEKVTYVREQALIGSYLETNLADVGGVASYSGLAANWTKAGSPVLHRSVAQPYSPLIASKAISPKQVDAMQKTLATLESKPEGAEVLKALGFAGFDTTGAKRLQDLLTWLEKGK